MPARICAPRSRRLGGEHGIDVVYDPVGGPYAEPALRSMAWDGRYLVIGFAAGEIPKLPLNLVLLKNCDIRGVSWGAWVAARAASAARTDARHRDVGGARQAQRARARNLSAADIASALKAIADRKVMGKIVLHP